MTRQPVASGGGGCSISLSMHQRKAARVLPLPVGARIKVDSLRAMAGQPKRCGVVGFSKTARSQDAVMGWNSERTSVSTGRLLSTFVTRFGLGGFTALAIDLCLRSEAWGTRGFSC